MDHSSWRRSRCFQSFLLLAVVVLVWGPSGMRSLRFEVESGHTKCISEDINLNGMSVGKYSVINPADVRNPNRPDEATANQRPLPDSHRVTVTVTSPYGTSIHYGERVESGNFAFTASESGDFMTCFWTPDHKPPVKVTVDFEWRTGMAAKDWSSVAKKDQIDLMGLELKKMEDIVKTIHDEIFYLREREDQMQELNRSTNSRMAWLSFLSLVVCLSVAGLQLWHLKTFFEKKKII